MKNGLFPGKLEVHSNRFSKHGIQFRNFVKQFMHESSDPRNLRREITRRQQLQKITINLASVVFNCVMKKKYNKNLLERLLAPNYRFAVLVNLTSSTKNHKLV